MRISLLIIIVTFMSTVLASPTDQQIKNILIKQSVNNYLTTIGNCPCPYNLDKDGRICGEKSAWSKNGGRFPICYPSDVSQKMILEYRERINMNEGGTDDSGPFKNYK